MERARSKTRYAFVDALRGVAATLVVLLHIYSYNLVPMTGYEFPQPLDAIFSHGNLGVYVFFVISGFVIAQSITNQTVTPRYLGWFALRRSIRLDPPYWATIAAMIVLSLISNHIQHERSLPIPSGAAVLAHVFYLQMFLGYPHIVGVFWTLCYEIQFYLVLAVGVGVSQWLGRKRASLASPWLIFVPLWIASLLCVSVLDLPKAVFLWGWPYFFFGVAVNWVHNKKVGAHVLWIAIPMMFAAAAFSLDTHHYGFLSVGTAVCTGLAIHAVSRADRLATLTLGPVLQYLGRISYSLYLVHMLVGTPLVRLGIRLIGARPDALHATALVVIALGASIAAAHLLYVVVERPAHRLSQRLRRFDEVRNVSY